MMKDIKEYITYRFQKAKEAYKDAELLAENNSWNACVNRLYYACFYSVTALLLQNELEAKSHNGIRTLFFREFIKTEKIDKNFGKLYSDLFDWRNKGDYADFIDFSREDVKPILTKTNNFLDSIEKLLESQ